jgi:peptidyl-prolyl cis-trans isomerase A (cyclophilin A)
LTRCAAIAVLVTALAGCTREPSSEAPARAAAPVAAPDSFDVTFTTTRGDVVVRVHRQWAPLGADRLYTLVRRGYYDDTRFFRVLSDFMAQFGASGDPAVARQWSDSTIADDPVVQSNERGMVSFASAGPNTRTTQLFINTADNPRLDGMGFSPVGRVVSGMTAVDSLYSGYGEGAPMGQGPDQAMISREGNAYLDRDFPRLDAIREARIGAEWPGGS